MDDSHLSDRMSQVIDALSSGANLTEAAAAGGVHSNTIANWRRNSPQFQHALAHAQSDRALMFRERAEDLADLAFDSLREILSDPEASPSVRLKAATFIIRTAMAATPQKAYKPLNLNDLFNAPPDSDLPAAPEEGEAEQVKPAESAFAQECTTANPQNLHNDAQKPESYRRPKPKIGRNHPCPCGSGHKYKRCCLGKSHAAAA
jgi:transposase-like protein